MVVKTLWARGTNPLSAYLQILSVHIFINIYHFMKFFKEFRVCTMQKSHILGIGERIRWLGAKKAKRTNIECCLSAAFDNAPEEVFFLSHLFSFLLQWRPDGKEFF